MKNNCDIEQLMDRSGVPSTPNRKCVLKIISDSPKALTPKTILEFLRQKKTIDKVTLYRILDLFVAKKILRRISNSNGSMCYEIICREHHPRHPHFICRECGDMECLEQIDVEEATKKIGLKRFSHHELDLNLEGICLQCKEK